MSIPSPLPRPLQHEAHPTTLQALIDAAERRFIVRALEETGGSRKRAAAQLGISRSTLFNKMRKHDLLAKPDGNGLHEASHKAVEEEAPSAGRSGAPPVFFVHPPVRFG